MKDSFGSAYMIYVFIFFVIIFVIFISLILKYAQAFKVKDQIISIIEEYEGYDYRVINDIQNYIESTSYRTEIDNKTYNKIDGDCNTEYRYCIATHSTGNATYYTVYTFVSWNFPFFNLSGVWNIQGETRPVVSNVVQDYS